jgi:hypothetical protein
LEHRNDRRRQPPARRERRPARDGVGILIFGIDDHDERGWFSRGEATYRRELVSADKLKGELERLMEGLRPALAGIGDGLGGFSVEQIEISAEISAKGTVSLLGSGGEVSGTGGITIVLTRRTADPAAESSA